MAVFIFLFLALLQVGRFVERSACFAFEEWSGSPSFKGVVWSRNGASSHHRLQRGHLQERKRYNCKRNNERLKYASVNSFAFLPCLRSSRAFLWSTNNKKNSQSATGARLRIQHFSEYRLTAVFWPTKKRMKRPARTFDIGNTSGFLSPSLMRPDWLNDLLLKKRLGSGACLHIITYFFTQMTHTSGLDYHPEAFAIWKLFIIDFV